MRKASNTSRVVWAILVGGAFLSITLMQLTSAAAKPPDGKGGGKGGGGGGSAPPAVEDLAVIVDPASHNTITLVWHAPGDSSFTAVAYDIRYLIGEPVTDANWDAAWVTYSERDLEPVPQPGGSLEMVTIQHLAGDQDYYFALRVLGSKGKVSAISNWVFAMTASAPVGVWDIELLTQASISNHADFAFDPADDQPSVIYSDLGSNEMRFAHFNSNSIWETEVVLPNAGNAIVRLDFDPMNRPTIIFLGSGIEGIWYGVRDSGECHSEEEWCFQQISSLLVNGGVYDLHHDASGNPHVLFDLLVTGRGKSRTRSRQLTFASRDGAGWQTELIDTSDGFLHASMALDADGNALVAYSRPIVDSPGPATLRLARRSESESGVGWTIETIQDFVDEHPSRISMAIDPGTGSPLIAFKMIKSFTPDDLLQVARFVDEAWQIELVDPFALKINKPHLRFDPTGAAVIVYLNSGSVGETSTVLLARDNGTSWEIEVVAEYDAFLVGLRAPRLRFDTFSGNATILFAVNHNGSSLIPNIDELFLTWKVGN